MFKTAKSLITVRVRSEREFVTRERNPSWWAPARDHLAARNVDPFVVSLPSSTGFPKLG